MESMNALVSHIPFFRSPPLVAFDQSFTEGEKNFN